MIAPLGEYYGIMGVLKLGSVLAEVDGEGVCAMWTSTEKIYSPLMSSGLLLMQRSWVFYQNFVFGWNKKWKFSVDINLILGRKLTLCTPLVNV